MATLPILSDQNLSNSAAELFEEIKETRQTEYVNHFWRVMANHPEQARRVWEQLQEVMAPGALDPLVKELIYIAVSTANNCEYCIHSHTASARKRGMTSEMYAELLEVVSMASQTKPYQTRPTQTNPDQPRAAWSQTRPTQSNPEPPEIGRAHV